jgi:hypothetical protein
MEYPWSIYGVSMEYLCLFYASGMGIVCLKDRRHISLKGRNSLAFEKVFQKLNGVLLPWDVLHQVFTNQAKNA